MRKSLIAVAILGLAFCGQLFLNPQAYATDPSTFNPGRIIDDEVFYNKDTMNVSDIQAFLDAHVPTCDTWGTQPSGYGNLTRAQYAQQVMGWPGPPYVCLNNYYENPSTGQTSFEMGGGAFSGGQSAAQIIYNAAQQYGINPQVLLITLRKESLNLFGDSWPMKSQYAYAMGYACPDSGPNNSANCSSTYAGFYNQVNKSAWQFRYYYDHMGSYNYAPGRWNTIQYSTDPSCGSENVFIDNYATASLYIYTPYTPNQASLYAYPGTASCGSYGNRNFWYMWQEWFGSPYAGVHITSPLRIKSQFGNNVFANIPTTASFDITNDSGSDINVGGMTVAVRDSGGGNHDFALQSMVIPAHSTRTYSQTQTLNKEDTYTFSLSNYSNGTWNTNYPTMLNVVEPRSHTLALWNAPSLTQSVTVQGGALHVNKTSTISYTIVNNSATAQTIGSLGLLARGPNGQNFDPAPVASITLAAGESRTLSYQFKPSIEGKYTFGVAALLSDWVSGYPIPLNSAVSGTVQSTVLPQVTLSAPLTTSSADPHTDQTVPVQYSVTNYGDASIDMGKLGISGRDPLGHNVDPGITTATLNSGETRVISFSLKPMVAGTYTFGVLGQQGTTWNTGPASPDGYARTLGLNVKNGVVVSATPVLAAGVTGYQGATESLQYTVKNYGEDSANLGKLGLWGRDPQGRNVDPGLVSTTLNPGETRVLSFNTTFQSTGTYKYGILQTIDNGVTWQSGPPTEGTAQKAMSVGVVQGVSVTQGVQSSLDVQHAHASQGTTLSYSVTNSSDQILNLGKLGLWGRDPQGRNVDPGLVSTTLNPGETRVLSFNTTFQSTGTYKYGILQTMDGGATWTNGPTVSSGQSSSLQIGVKPSVTVTVSLAPSAAQISAGQCENLTYSVENFDTINSANLGKLGLWGRDPQGRNVDPGLVSTTLNPGETRVISFNFCPSVTGSYSFGTLETLDNGATWTSGPVKELESILNQIQVSVT